MIFMPTSRDRLREARGALLVTEEHWSALLDERSYPLLSVMRRHDARKSRLLDGEPVVDRRIHSTVDGRKGRGERQRRLAGKLRSQVNGDAKKVVPRNDAVGQAEPCSLGRVEDPPAQDQLRRGLAAHVPGQALGAAEGWNDPDVDLGLRERRGIGRDRNVRRLPPNAKPFTAAMMG